MDIVEDEHNKLPNGTLIHQPNIGIEVAHSRRGNIIIHHHHHHLVVVLM